MFALVCTADISQDILNNFLTNAYTNNSAPERFHLVTSYDISTPPQPTEPPVPTPENTTRFPPSLNEYEAMNFISENLASKYTEINAEVFYILDQHTLITKTCLIASTTPQHLQPEDEHVCYVRCRPEYAIESMVALLTGEKTRPQLVNVAALAGGAIGPYREPTIDDIIDPGTRLMIQELSQRETPQGYEEWLNEYGLIPVFCTVEIPAEILDELLNLAHLENDNEDPHQGLYIVQNPPFDFTHAKTSHPPLQPPTNPFLGASIAHLSLFCKHNLRRPIQNSTFVVLDQHTLSDKSALLVDNYWRDTPPEKARTAEMLMCRASFADTLVTLGGLNTKGALSMNAHADTAAEMGGVLRVFEEAVRMHGPVQHKAVKVEDIDDEDAQQL